VRSIIHNLKSQHRDLTRITMEIVSRLEPVELAVDASEVRRCLRMLTGILKVHLAMEDKSFYPYLLSHRDAELRQLAEEFLAEREQIQARYLAFIERWLEAGVIESDAATFVEETRAMLMALGMRMMQEDREFHPLILERAEAT
jgi:hemerythrin-like domain-containing protein